MGRIIDLNGQKFNRLTVKQFKGKNKNHQAVWICECECGNKTEAIGNELRSGHKKSCGCLHKDKITKHGLRYTKLNRVYSSMKSRCYNENNQSFHNYGGRGIEVCGEWLGDNGFETFYEWAISNGYEEGLTIDRVENDGNYSPNNCQWVDMKTQQNNKRVNRLITINGITKNISEWSEEVGISNSAFSERVKAGWKDEDLLKPSQVTSKSKVKGVTWNKEIKKWVVRVNINGKRKYIGSYKDINEAIQMQNDYIDKLNVKKGRLINEGSTRTIQPNHNLIT